MEELIVWIYVLVAVGVALAANSVSAVWAKQQKRLSWWLLAVILISPFVFITFGLVTEKVGVAVGSGTMDSLLSLGTIAIGLFFFKELKKLSTFQYAGLVCVAVGILLLMG